MLKKVNGKPHGFNVVKVFTLHKVHDFRQYRYKDIQGKEGCFLSTHKRKGLRKLLSYDNSSLSDSSSISTFTLFISESIKRDGI